MENQLFFYGCFLLLSNIIFDSVEDEDDGVILDGQGRENISFKKNMRTYLEPDEISKTGVFFAKIVKDWNLLAMLDKR